MHLKYTHHHHHHILFLSSLLLFSKDAIGDGIVKITNENDFSTLVDNVNNKRISYSGTTVLLDSDLSLSGYTINSIGNTSTNYFRGTFDGQGHIISGLKMNSSSQYTGLFGYSNDLTIRNVVLDSSCSVISSYNGQTRAYVGGFIGECFRECDIENSVNMAVITFSGKISNSESLYLGGIIGELSSSSTGYKSHIENCANYGPVTHSGTSEYTYIGGIAGDLNVNFWKYAYNCINHGTITHSGTTSRTLYLGGIVGHSYYTYIENCVSAGEVYIQNTPSNSYIGSIIGYISSHIHINYCYYTSELSGYSLYDSKAPTSTSYILSYDNNTFELSRSVSVGSYTGNSLIDALNAAADYYVLRDYSNWLFNKEKKSVSFIINGRTNPITMDYQIILLPSLASERSLMFDGWYTDSDCKNPLQSFEITEDKTLYGRFEENTNKYTITFDTRREGVIVASKTAQFGTVVSLPSESLRDDCNISFWEDDYGDNVGLSPTMPAHNITLYAVWKCTHITRPDDFADLSKVVNSGMDYYLGTTVYLDSDLSLSGGTLETIGHISSYQFRGVFDGQGHIISDLKMNQSFSYHTGLFGYSYGLTIRNVVLDPSCSIMNSFSGSSSLYAGGIIGGCFGTLGHCTIENNVNMANITFNGSIDTGYLYLGGIAGELYSYPSYSAYTKNCVNYGSVMHSGTSYISYIGGITGYIYNHYSNYTYIQNSLNYGTITHNGTSSSDLYIGGITGYSSYTYIENCVSAGKIFTQNTPSKSYVGSIIGKVGDNTTITYCYYTSDVGGYGINGTGTPESMSNTPDSPTTVDSLLVSKLNNQAASNEGWSKWLLNTNNVTVSFTLNNNNGLNLSSQLILLPNLTDGWRTFVGWFSDNSYATSFSSSAISSSTTLYGRWDKYTVAFDVNGGNKLTTTSKTITFGSTYGNLPLPTREGYAFMGWFTDNNVNVTSETTVSIASDHTLHAQWSGNRYTVTFDVNGGNKLTTTSKTVTFNSTYGDFPLPTREGYAFMGWFTDNNVSVTNKTTVTIANNHTLHARWDVPTTQVEIVFNSKDLTREDVERIIQEYTDGSTEFTITIFGEDRPGEIKVIVEFTDIKTAEEFVRSVKSDSNNNALIIRIDFVPSDASFSSLLYPVVLLIALAL